jgi:NADP-dependent 3-hydroxy acid dehydrogenase YdfG
MSQEKQILMVTGAAGNLGHAVATRFAQAGATLVLLDLDRQRLQERYGQETERQSFVLADLLGRVEVTAAVKSSAWPPMPR